jgi:hypothetical protein
LSGDFAAAVPVSVDVAVAVATAGAVEVAVAAGLADGDDDDTGISVPPVVTGSSTLTLDAPSAGTLARPTTWSDDRSRSEWSPSTLSRVTGFIEVPVVPDFACVSVIN